MYFKSDSLIVTINNHRCSEIKFAYTFRTYVTVCIFF